MSLPPSMNKLIDDGSCRTVAQSIIKHCSEASGVRINPHTVALSPPCKLFEIDYLGGAGEAAGASKTAEEDYPPLTHLRFHFRQSERFSWPDTETAVLHSSIGLGGRILWSVVIHPGQVENYFSVEKREAPGFKAIIESANPWCELEICSHILPIIQEGSTRPDEPVEYIDVHSISPYPLLFWPRNGPSPTGPLLSMASRMGGGSFVYQVLFQVLPETWMHNCLRIADAARNSTKITPAGHHSSLMDQVAHDGLKKASAGTLFTACVRAASLGSSIQPDLLGMARTIFSTSRHGGNSLVLRTRADFELRGLNQDELLSMIKDGTTHNHGMVLTSRELTDFVHLPDSEALRNHTIPFRRLRGPKSHFRIDQEGPLLGYVHGASGRHPIHQPDRIRTRHTVLLGITGKGKSSAMENLILSDIANHRGIAVIDFGGDMLSRIGAMVPEEFHDRILYLNPGLEHHAIAHNHLALPSGVRVSIAAEQAVAIDRGTYPASAWGPNIETVLLQCYTALMSVPGHCRADIPVLLGNDADAKNLRTELIDKVSGPVATFLIRGIDRIGKELRNRVVGKVERFMAHEILRRSLSQRMSRFSFRELLDEGVAVLIDLSPSLGPDGVRLLGSLYLNDLYHAALSRSNLAPEDRKPAFIYIDECQKLLQSDLEHCFEELRKFEVGVNLAFHYPEQLPQDLQNAIRPEGRWSPSGTPGRI